jgi:adenylate cyclase
MGKEIERKFLVDPYGAWREAEAKFYRQGYLQRTIERTVRVRTAGERAFLTIKGHSEGAARLEFEYEIPVAEANELLDVLCERPLIEKTRRTLSYANLVWEVDEFFGDNADLIVAEVELQDEAQPIILPPWVGDEVTQDPRYYNANLVQNPYCLWRNQ